LQNPVHEFLAASPEDGEMEGRFKNAVEGLGLGGLTEGLLLTVKAVVKARAAKAAAREAGLRSLGDADAPLVGVRNAGADTSGVALRAPRSAETEALEKAGFAVDRDVMEAPITADNKRRYGIRRETLEAEGELGERWTRIETKPEEWPALRENRRRTGQWVKEWREFGKSLYNKMLGQRHTVASTGDSIVLGSEGRRHMLGQGQTPEGIKAIPHLPELIQKAFKTGEYNPKPSQGRNPNMRPATIYHSAAVIDGKPYDVQLVAKRNAAGEQELMFYDLRAKGKTADGPIDPRLPQGE